jgi:DNA-binding response OmpR family regulator
VHTESLAPLPVQSPTRPVIVLAIDDEEMRATYAFAILAVGFEVMTADHAIDVQHDRRALLADIIVVDVSPASRHGWPFVQKLKRHRRTFDIPVIAVAANVGTATCERARREGCVAVCVRGCPAEMMAAGIRAVLDRARA